MTEPDTYEQLTAHFDVHHHDTRGGIEITFVTGEQVATRLNDALGPGGWSFRILHQDTHPEADEVWVLGELEAVIDGERVVRQQFGSDKIQRSRSTGAPLDIGFDFKSAATDCLKKCASLIGVGLYLYDKEELQRLRKEEQRAERAAPRQSAPNAERQPAQRQVPPTPRQQTVQKLVEIHCAAKDCNEVLQPVDEKKWSAVDLANAGQKLANRPFCWEHYQAAAKIVTHGATGQQ